MKFILQLVCVFAILSVSLCALTEKEEADLAEKCRDQVGATKDDLKILEKKNGTIPSNQKQYCLIACVYKATGMMDADNKFVLAKALEEIEVVKEESVEAYNKMNNIIKDCVKTVVPDKKDECNSAKIFLDCVINKVKAAIVQ